QDRRPASPDTAVRSWTAETRNNSAPWCVPRRSEACPYSPRGVRRRRGSHGSSPPTNRRDQAGRTPHASAPHTETAARASFALPPRGARRRIPFGAVRLLLELRADDERLPQILRILDHGRHQQQSTAARKRGQLEVLGELRVLTIGHTVSAQI